MGMNLTRNKKLIVMLDWLRTHRLLHVSVSRLGVGAFSMELELGGNGYVYGEPSSTD